MLPIERSPSRSAYIHVPFCTHRCGYCNFTLVAGRDDLIDGYLEAIGLELAQLGEPREVETLYLGGGTPTRLRPQQLDRLLEVVLHWHPLAPGGELTVEANPRDVDDEIANVLSRRGVSRCSLGAQSFDRRKLGVLERDHREEEIRQAVARIQDVGIAVGLDLIFAAPDETLGGWRRDLDEAVGVEPQHISTYGLTYEKGTSFWSRRDKGQLIEANDDLQREMYAHAIDRLTAAGFEHYEVSNFARPGQRSRHNQAYWCGAPYYAAGPGASRYLGGVRETNHRSTTTWIRRMLSGESPVAERDVLAPPDRARELLVIGLRRIEGVDRGDFRHRTGFEIDELAGAAIERYVRDGLLADDGTRVRLTREGLFVSDALWPDIL